MKAYRNMPETHRKIIELYRLGHNQYFIADQCGVNQSTVSRVIKATVGGQFEIGYKLRESAQTYIISETALGKTTDDISKDSGILPIDIEECRELSSALLLHEF